MTNEIHFLIVLPTSFCQMFSPRAKIGFDFLVPAAGRAGSFASFVVISFFDVSRTLGWWSSGRVGFGFRDFLKVSKTFCDFVRLTG
jgi:hypothetical protein